MPEFPKLKTGVSVQYPFVRSEYRSTRVLTFLDGGEQRFAKSRSRKRWVVKLAFLTETEIERVCEFAQRHLDTGEPFSFIDPVDGAVYETCVLEGNAHWARGEGEGRHSTELVITEKAN